VIILYILAALLGLGIAYQALDSYRDARRWPAPGRMVKIGACRLHLYELGVGGPVVVLESGIAATSLSWALVQPQVAEFTRVASYDRAGLGWSGDSTAPRTIERMVSELAALLEAANLRPPYVLVGHSFGGLLIRAFAHLRPGEAGGLVLVDPVSLNSWKNCSPGDKQRLRLGASLSRRGAILARLGVVRVALAVLVSGGRRLPQWIARASAPRATGFLANMVGQVQKLPAALRPMVRAHWSNPKSFRAMAAYLGCLPASARAVLEMQIPPAVPVTILSASSATAEELKERDEWARQSSHGRHRIVEDTGHWILLERPEEVAGAIRDIVEKVRERRRI
jgi:pimeloyl-ACP methyl ester carboxylesterase